MYWVFRVDLCEFHQWRKDSNMQLWRLGSFESQNKKNFKHFPAQILRWSVGQPGSSENRPRIYWLMVTIPTKRVSLGGSIPLFETNPTSSIWWNSHPPQAQFQARHGFSTSFREQRWHTLSNPQVNVLVPKVFEGSIPFAGFGLDDVRWMQNWSIRTKDHKGGELQRKMTINGICVLNIFRLIQISTLPVSKFL